MFILVTHVICEGETEPSLVNLDKVRYIVPAKEHALIVLEERNIITLESFETIKNILDGGFIC